MKVVVPLHISGFWVPYIEPDPMLSGSLGVGIALEPGVTGIIGGNRGIVLNGEKLPSQEVEAISKLVGYEIPSLIIDSPADLGLGYGLSSAISWVISISSIAKNLNKKVFSRELLYRAGKVAHTIEVLNKTGLGDVIAQFVGEGLVVRVKPGPPGIGKAYSIKLDNRVAIVTTSLTQMNTPTMLDLLGPKLRVCGRLAYTKFFRNESLSSFLESAEFFSKCSGMAEVLSKEVSRALNSFIKDGCLLGYFVKKGLLVSLVESSCVPEILSTLSKKGLSAKVFRPSSKGVRVIKD